jgi:hypothetical protein
MRSTFDVRAIVIAALAVGACGGNTNPQPDVPDAARADARVPDAAADASPDAAPSCTSAAGCFVCTPVELVEFLNACTDSSCQPFDNAARLPLYNNGVLPPLP